MFYDFNNFKQRDRSRPKIAVVDEKPTAGFVKEVENIWN
jgi:hypothetical protein